MLSSTNLVLNQQQQNNTFRFLEDMNDKIPNVNNINASNTTGSRKSISISTPPGGIPNISKTSVGIAIATPSVTNPSNTSTRNSRISQGSILPPGSPPPPPPELRGRKPSSNFSTSTSPNRKVSTTVQILEEIESTLFRKLSGRKMSQSSTSTSTTTDNNLAGPRNSIRKPSASASASASTARRISLMAIAPPQKNPASVSTSQSGQGRVSVATGRSASSIIGISGSSVKKSSTAAAATTTGSTLNLPLAGQGRKSVSFEKAATAAASRPSAAAANSTTATVQVVKSAPPPAGAGVTSVKSSVVTKPNPMNQPSPGGGAAAEAENQHQQQPSGAPNKNWGKIRKLLEHGNLQAAMSGMRKKNTAISLSELESGLAKKIEEHVFSPLKMPPKRVYANICSKWFRKCCNMFCLHCTTDIEENEAETDEPWMFEPRSNKSDDFVEYLYHMYSKKQVRPTHREARTHLLLTLKVCLVTITHEQVCSLLCNQIIRTLSYSGTIREQGLDLTETELKLTEDKSIHGGFIWLITHGLKSLDELELVEEQREFIYEKLADVLAINIELSAAILHVAKTAEFALDEIDFAVARHLFTFHGVRGEFDDDDVHHPQEPTDLTNHELKRLFHRHRAMKRLETDTRKEFLASFQWKKYKVRNLTGRTDLNKSIRIISKFEKDPLWYRLDEFPDIPQFNILVMVMVKLITDSKHVLSYLQKAHRLLIGPPRIIEMFDKETGQVLADCLPTENLFEDATQIREVIASQHKFPNWLLTKTEAANLHDVGFDMLDRVDELRYQLYTIKKLGRESKAMHQLCYEYLQKSMGWPIRDYKEFVPAIELELYKRWAHNKQFRAWEGEPPLVKLTNVRQLFEISVYPLLLSIIPVKAQHQLQLQIEFYDDEDVDGDGGLSEQSTQSSLPIKSSSV